MYLLQFGDYLRKEKSIVLKLGYPFENCAYENLNESIPGYLVPIGTVEFTKRYAELNNIMLPTNITYPIELVSYLNRKIHSGTYESAPLDKFVKPKHTKVFTGAIKNEITETVNNDTPVWISDIINFTSEYRIYVHNKKIVGYSRYDDGDNEDMEPDFNVINKMIEEYTSQPFGYSIDVGISDNKTVLIEVNDGWALGYYPWGNMTEQKYIQLITDRWIEIVARI